MPCFADSESYFLLAATIATAPPRTRAPPDPRATQVPVVMWRPAGAEAAVAVTGSGAAGGGVGLAAGARATGAGGASCVDWPARMELTSWATVDSAAFARASSF